MDSNKLIIRRTTKNDLEGIVRMIQVILGRFDGETEVLRLVIILRNWQILRKCPVALD